MRLPLRPISGAELLCTRSLGSDLIGLAGWRGGGWWWSRRPFCLPCLSGCLSGCRCCRCCHPPWLPLPFDTGAVPPVRVSNRPPPLPRARRRRPRGIRQDCCLWRGLERGHAHITYPTSALLPQPAPAVLANHSATYSNPPPPQSSRSHSSRPGLLACSFSKKGLCFAQTPPKPRQKGAGPRSGRVAVAPFPDVRPLNRRQLMALLLARRAPPVVVTSQLPRDAISDSRPPLAPASANGQPMACALRPDSHQIHTRRAFSCS